MEIVKKGDLDRLKRLANLSVKDVAVYSKRIKTNTKSNLNTTKYILLVNARPVEEVAIRTVK